MHPPTRVLRPVRCLLLLWLLLLCIGLVGCSDVRDRDIASSFENNRAAFERVVKLAISSDLSCQADKGELKCNNQGALPTFEELHKKAEVNAIQARKDIPQLGNAVYFVMASYGPITTNSYSKGVVYSTASLSPIVENTANHPDMRFRFRTLDDHWYVFVMP